MCLLSNHKPLLVDSSLSASETSSWNWLLPVGKAILLPQPPYKTRYSGSLTSAPSLPPAPHPPASHPIQQSHSQFMEYAILLLALCCPPYGLGSNAMC